MVLLLLTGAFNLPARSFNLATCAFSLLTRGFLCVTRGSELVARGFKLVTSESELVTRVFELVTRGFELVTCRFELVTRGLELVTCGFELVTRGLELVTRMHVWIRNLQLVTRVLLFHKSPLSCADLYWNKLISIIADWKCQKIILWRHKWYGFLNPVLLARHFQKRVENFFQTIVINGLLGKVHYHAIRIKFQVRGSPKVDSLLWIVDAPILTKETIYEYVAFVDSIVKATVPDRASEKE